MPQLPTVGPGRQFAVSQRVVQTADGLRPDTPLPPVKQQPVTKAAGERTAYPLKRRVERQIGPATINPSLFSRWLTQSLEGHRFARPAAEAKQENKETNEQVNELLKEVTKLAKEGDDSGPGEIAKLPEQGTAESTAALGEFFDALVEVLGDPTDLELISAVKDTAEAVADSIPFLGTIVAGVKLLAKGVTLAMLAKEAYDVSRAKESSFSLLEHAVYGGIHSYQAEKGIQIGKEMVTTAATGAAAAFGAGGVVSIATKLVDVVVKIATAIYRAAQIKKLNDQIKQGRPLGLQNLKDTPILGLHLPWLAGMDGLTVLGLAPVGWQLSGDKEGIMKALNAEAAAGRLRSTDLGWLTSSLQWNDPQTRYRSPLLGFTPDGKPVRLGGAAAAAASPPTEAQNPWTSEFKRAIEMLKWTDTYLYAQKWRLYAKDGKILHEPAPTGLLDRAQEAVKEKVKAAVGALTPQGGLPAVPSGRGSAVGGGKS